VTRSPTIISATILQRSSRNSQSLPATPNGV
jgi:hypothetical protein